MSALSIIIGVIVSFLVVSCGSKSVLPFAGIYIFFIGVVWPIIPLFMFVVLYPLFSTFSVSLGAGIPDLSFSRLCAMMLISVLLLHNYAYKSHLKKIEYSETWMLMFCICAILSMYINNPGKFSSNILNFADNFIIPFILFFIAKNIIIDKRTFVRFVNILMIPAIYLACIGIYEYLTWNDVLPAIFNPNVPKELQGLRLNEGIIRANGPFPYPETFGVVLAMILIMISYNIGSQNGIRNHNRFIKWMRILIFPLIGVGLYCAMFRSIWMGAIMGLTARFGILRGKRLKTVFVLLSLGLVVWASAEIIQSKDIYLRRLSNLETVYTRIATYKSGLAMFFDNPIIGVGYNNYTNTYEQYNHYYRTYKGSSSVDSAHNAYLSLLVETGILGFISYILIITSFLKHSIRIHISKRHGAEKKDTGAICLGILISVMVPSFFDNIILWANVNNLLYPLMGAIFAQDARCDTECLNELV